VSHHAPKVVCGLSRYIRPSVDFDHIFLLKPVIHVGVFTIKNDIHNSAGIFPKDKSHLCFASFHVSIPVSYKVFINPGACHRSLDIGKLGIGLYIWGVHIFQDADAIKSTVPLISEDDFSVRVRGFDTCFLVCRQYESSWTATDCIFPNCATCVTAGTLSFVLVARMRWSFSAVLDLIAVSDGEVKERRFSKSRGCLLEKGVRSGAVCKSFVPHSKLAQVADEPLTRLKAAVFGILFLTQDPSRSAGHSVRAAGLLLMQFAVDVHGIGSASTAEREAIKLTLLDGISQG